MSRILITTLGKGQPPRNNPEAVHGNYQTAQYRFEDGVSSEPTQFFGLALYHHLVETGWKPDGIVVLGTSTSMWDAWLESAPELAEHGEFASALYELQKPGSKGVSADDLRRLSDILSDHYQVDFDCRLIPFGRTQDEQADILRVLDGAVGSGNEVILDVTHGFRHLPMLEMLSSFLLSHVKNVETKSIYYGALDMPGIDGTKPVVRLDALSNLEKWIEAVAVLDSSGNVLPLSTACSGLPNGETVQSNFERYQFLSEMNEVFPLRSTAKTISDWIKTVAPTSAMLALFQDVLLDFFAWYSLPLAQGQLALAERALQTGRRDKAVMLAFESVITAHLAPGDKPTDYTARTEVERHISDVFSRKADNCWWLLKDLRNALAHGTFSGSSRMKDRINGMRSDANRFSSEIKRLMDWVRNEVAGA